MGRAHGSPMPPKSEAIPHGFGILTGRGQTLSRTLNDDFDEDDLPSGNLDLEKGSAQVGAGVPSNYGGDGIDFDDDLYGNDEGPGASLELDMPRSGPASGHGHGASSPPGGAPPQMTMAAPGSVPDLAMPPPRSSGSLPAARTSGQQPAVRPSGQQKAVAPPPPPPASEGHNGFAPPPPSSSAAPGGTMAPSPQSSGQLPAAHANGPGMVAHSMAPQPAPPPGKPTPAALIAKYPAPPSGIASAPMYAVRVIMRQLELRTDLESLRRRRSPDVPLYEAALRAYDTKTFRLGMAINCAALAVATFIFFLPVILRFMRD
jgi:hypothetical protein